MPIIGFDAFDHNYNHDKFIFGNSEFNVQYRDDKELEFFTKCFVRNINVAKVFSNTINKKILYYTRLTKNGGYCSNYYDSWIYFYSFLKKLDFDEYNDKKYQNTIITLFRECIDAIALI